MHSISWVQSFFLTPAQPWSFIIQPYYFLFSIFHDKFGFFLFFDIAMHSFKENYHWVPEVLYNSNVVGHLLPRYSQPYLLFSAQAHQSCPGVVLTPFNTALALSIAQIHRFEEMVRINAMLAFFVPTLLKCDQQISVCDKAEKMQARNGKHACEFLVV